MEPAEKYQGILEMVHLLKGNEKEFYKGEQRDLLLYLLKEELKNNHNQKQQQINSYNFLNKILLLVIEIKYLTDILNLLVNEGLSKKSIDTLSRYGIILSHTGKHPTTTFF